MTELQPWTEREKRNTRRVVRTVKRGFQRIEKLWDENEIPEARAGESCCHGAGQT